MDIPTLPWPKADFPRYKYPLHENERENREEDDRCLASVEEHIEAQAKMNVPVAGIIVEPIQAEGGDYHGSKYFFQVRCTESLKSHLQLGFHNVLDIQSPSFSEDLPSCALVYALSKPVF